VNRLRVAAITAALSASLLSAGCAGTTSPATRPVAAVDPLTAVGGSLVVAAGDIACAPGEPVTTTTCQDAATARQTKAYNPRYAFVLGDEQYGSGSVAEFRGGYAKTWGPLLSISRPIPGNHEYRTANAAGYYSFFAAKTRAPGYYAFNVGNWRVYALNSNCDKVNCATENTWLERDMAANPRKCSAVMMHHPLYSSGLEHGDSIEGRRFWTTALRHRADLVLAGHDHDYERFQRMNASGQPSSTGITSFVVGTGGKSLYHSRGLRAGSQVYDASRAGVLRLKLGTHRFGYKYTTIDGRTLDQGITYCG
jgi:hypothetical protein